MHRASPFSAVRVATCLFPNDLGGLVISYYCIAVVIDSSWLCHIGNLQIRPSISALKCHSSPVMLTVIAVIVATFCSSFFEIRVCSWFTSWGIIMSHLVPEWTVSEQWRESNTIAYWKSNPSARLSAGILLNDNINISSSVCGRRSFLSYLLERKYGTVYLLMLHLPCCYQFSRTDWKLIYSAASMTFPRYNGPCNSFICLGHSEKSDDWFIDWLMDSSMICLTIASDEVRCRGRYLRNPDTRDNTQTRRAESEPEKSGETAFVTARQGWYALFCLPPVKLHSVFVSEIHLQGCDFPRKTWNQKVR